MRTPVYMASRAISILILSLSLLRILSKKRNNDVRRRAAMGTANGAKFILWFLFIFFVSFSFSILNLEFVNCDVSTSIARALLIFNTCLGRRSMGILCFVSCVYTNVHYILLLLLLFCLFSSFSALESSLIFCVLLLLLPLLDFHVFLFVRCSFNSNNTRNVNAP